MVPGGRGLTNRGKIFCRFCRCGRRGKVPGRFRREGSFVSAKCDREAAPADRAPNLVMSEAGWGVGATAYSVFPCDALPSPSAR